MYFKQYFLRNNTNSILGVKSQLWKKRDGSLVKGTGWTPEDHGSIPSTHMEARSACISRIQYPHRDIHSGNVHKMIFQSHLYFISQFNLNMQENQS